MLLNYQITIGCTILGMIKNFLAIPRKLYIPRMTVVGNKSMNFANLGQCKLNSFANKNVCKQDDLMLSQVKWIINWGKFTNRRQRSLSSYRTSILTLNCMILSSLSNRDTYRRWVMAYKWSNADICVKFLDPPPLPTTFGVEEENVVKTTATMYNSLP